MSNRAALRGGRLQRCVHGSRQRGAAIVTVLLIVTLATVVVSGLFWREHVAVRSVENRLALAQTRWIERAAVDYARVILRTTLQAQTSVHFAQAWATPVERTPMDETITAGGRIEDRGRALAEISGRIYDAQGRMNLNNLVRADGKPELVHTTAFEHLLSSFGKSPALSELLVERLQRALLPTSPTGTQASNPAAGGKPGGGSADGQSTETVRRPASALRMKRLSDLLEIPGFDQDTIDRLSEHVIFLPVSPTKLNINTTTPEVIAAYMSSPNLAQARNFTSRLRTYQGADLGAASQLLGSGSLSAQVWETTSSYFLLRGAVHYDRVYTQIDALLQRQQTGLVQVIWQDRY